MFETFVYLGYLVLGVNLLLLLRYFPRHNQALRIFTWYTVLMSLIQATVYIMKENAINNIFLSHFYFLLQFILLSFFYLSIMRTNLQRNVIKVGLSTGLFAIALQFIFDGAVFWQFNLFEIFVTSFLLTIYSTIHFYNQLDEKKELYYINGGILMYLFASTVLFLAGNLVAKLSSERNTITWMLNSVLYVVYQVLIFIEIKNLYITPKFNADDQ